MKLNDFRTFFNKELENIYPKKEIDAFFFRIIEDEMGLSLLDLFTQKDTILNPSKLELFNNILNRLKKEEPIQYILGSTEFYGYKFYVNPYVLIPRPETEELISWVKENLTTDKTPKILDIGTGSGCIAITLKKELPNSDVFAIDISEGAIKTASNNAENNRAEINFIKHDILSEKKLEYKYDIIVSNPPYVRNLEKQEIKNNVLNNEPHLALFVEDDNPLIFYKRIADVAKYALNPNGILFFEINQYLGIETKEMLINKGFKNVTLKQDLFGNDRMIKANL
ncbi:peptide chain release factor N(5)-glutamine methyltransferase [uncultured Tenacibaculum sp.]|uniref:peptide chain release factor N(5)-glutamine methyltransferase n=1 Tax=uncultured Tenacibaculum sp. TaxID=174713 RepID=UPI002616017D|nr:peptide chain release factor N(5)-glutamine methyltransferase [uncultured Tenacibaculum sp.]